MIPFVPLVLVLHTILGAVLADVSHGSDAKVTVRLIRRCGSPAACLPRAVVDGVRTEAEHIWSSLDVRVVWIDSVDAASSAAADADMTVVLEETAAAPDAGATPAAVRLAAMRQPVAGPPGAVSACIVLLAEFAALAALPNGARPVALFLAPLCGRTAILAAYRLYPYARIEPTLSLQLKRSATTTTALVGCALAAAACFGVAGPGGLMLLVLSLMLMHAIALVALSRLGGLTGDVYGAICEVSQLGILLTAPFVLPR